MKLADKIEEEVTASTERLETQRAKLANLVAKSAPCADLASCLEKLAHYEGAACFYQHAARYLEQALDRGTDVQVKEELHELVTDVLLDGAGDTYSGRTNDVLRSRFDGTREACKRVSALTIRYSL